MIGRGGLEIRIEIGIGPRILNCVIGERLMKTCSIEAVLATRQRINKVRNFSYTILRQSLNSVDEFLLFHDSEYVAHGSDAEAQLM